ncbi:CHAT domain-containing protein [Cyathus striatus]|nr:CHAT domain-containing protein [Cyathus striatus]
MSNDQGTGIAIYDGSNQTPERPPGQRANKRYWEGSLHKDSDKETRDTIKVDRNPDLKSDEGTATAVVPVETNPDPSSDESTVPDGTPSELTKRGLALFKRYKRSGKLDDLNQCISTLRKAVLLTPKDDTNLRSRQSNLGTALKSRFNRTGKIKDIDGAIDIQKDAVAHLHDKDATRALAISALGSSFYARYSYTRSLSDLEESISQLTNAVELGRMTSTPDDQIMYLHNLANALVDRFLDLGKAEDLKSALARFEEAITLVSPNTEQNDVSTLQANFGAALRRSFEHWGKEDDLEKAISLQRQSESNTPADHPSKPNRLINLGISYKARFEKSAIITDIDEAISLGTRAVSLTADENIRKAEYLNHLGNFYRRRSRSLREKGLADIDEAVSAHSKAVDLAPNTSSLKAICLASLGATYNVLFSTSDNLEDNKAAISNLRQALQRSSSQGRAELATTLNELSSALSYRFERVGNMPDLEEAISLQLRCLDLTSEDDTSRPLRLHNISTWYTYKFETTGLLVDIDKAIAYEENSLGLFPEGNAMRCSLLQHLGNLYKYRIERFGDKDDGLKSMKAYRGAAILSVGSATQRLNSAKQWAELASEYDTANRLAAYETIMHLIPRVLWLGTTISTRYAELAWIGDTVNEAAVVAIEKEQYMLAVEWLEQGRSLIWGQILQLRTPVDELRDINPPLAERFVQVSHELESAGNIEPLVGQGTSVRDTSVEEHTRKHHRLAEEWDSLVNQIRSTPGFESFLRRKRLEELVKATSSGPIILVNVHRTRCDALILHSDATIIAVPLSILTYKNLLLLHGAVQKELRGSGVLSRGSKVVYDSGVAGGIGRALALLWRALVKPVLTSLKYEKREATSNDLPHVTWCVTGLLAFLPIHAAGSYGKGPDNEKIFVYVVSSYTPTLTALINSEKGSILGKTPSILAISQPATPGQKPLPSTTKEVESIKQHADPDHWTWLDGPAAKVNEVLHNMETHNWIHLACHASQRADVPMHSAFFLEDGELRLSTIMEKSFKHTELAFLSACQTASGDEKRPEEAFHLAAGMMMAGYRTVLATMWSIRDRDAPVVADLVYSRLLGKDGVGDGRREAAYALHQAVAHLRDKIGEKEFVAWVPFIHIGL